MKRLLSYLFIVLGLGLTFNVNAEEITNTAWKLSARKVILFLDDGKCRTKKSTIDSLIENIFGVFSSLR